MSDLVSYLLLGVGGGAVLAALALGLALTYQSSGVVNFAHAAIAVYFARAFYELRETGELVLPILGLPDRVSIVDTPTVATSFVVILTLAALTGALIYILVFRPLRRSPPLARVVASLGLFLYFLAIIADRFPSAAQIRPILPKDAVEILDRTIIVDRFWLAGIVIAAAAVLTAIYRWTRFGLATRAAAENEKGAVLVDLRPDWIAVVNWMLAMVLAAGGMILIGSVTRNLDATQFSLLIVPALAAALVGRFTSFGVITAAGLGIGMLQSLILSLETDVDWLPDIGLQAGIPLLIIVITMIVRGESLPSRGSLTRSHFPRAPNTTHATPVILGLALIGAAGLLVLGADWRLAIITTTIWTLLALSVVLLTGWVGQISLAPMAFAGVAAFALIRWTDDANLPFPIAPLLAASVAMLVGVVIGYPAVRVRGMNLAIVTIAAAAAIEELVFKWSWFTGGAGGATVTDPEIAGVNLAIGTDAASYPRAAFGVMCIVVTAIAALFAANLRRSSAGRRWLAVRANERAAAAAGVDVARAKLTAFAISSFLAGLGGTLLAYETGVLSANSFVVLESLALLSVTYLGGIAALAGALIAGILSDGGLLAELAPASSGSASADAARGLALIVVAIVYDEGIAGVLSAARRRLSAAFSR